MGDFFVFQYLIYFLKKFFFFCELIVELVSYNYVTRMLATD